MTELSALLTQSQKQNEDYEKMVKALRETMEILVRDPLFWESWEWACRFLSFMDREFRIPVKCSLMKSPKAKKLILVESENYLTHSFIHLINISCLLSLLYS